MKKIIAAALLAVMLCSLLCLTGCSRKTALTVDAFYNLMEENGYEAAYITDQYTEYDQLTGVCVAMQIYGEYQIEFYETDTDDTAKNLYANNQRILEDNTSIAYSRTVVNGVNSNAFKMTSNGQYYVLSRIDNTMIYIEAPEECKGEINGVLKTLGY